MELRQLEYFQMASRLKNITRAAQRLRVSQPNITVAIKKLEAELGVQLFDRSQKQLTLTPEGAVFLKRIELALRNIEDAVLEVNDYKQLQKGTIKIGIPPMMGAYLFPKVFSGFRHIHPHLDVLLYEEGSLWNHNHPRIRAEFERFKDEPQSTDGVCGEGQPACRKVAYNARRHCKIRFNHDERRSLSARSRSK